MEKPQISNWQVLVLIATTTLGTSILYAPADVTMKAGRDGWYLTLVAGLIGILNVLVFIWLQRLFPGKNLIQINKILLGKFLGTILNLLYISYFVRIGVFVLREFADFLLITVEPTTPMLVYIILGMIMSTYAVYHGLEVIGRMGEIILPVLLTSYFVIFTLSINEYDFNFLLPVLENGFLKPIMDPWLVIAWFGDAMFILMMLGYIRRPKKTAYFAVGGLAITLFMLTTAILCSIAMFGAETTATLTNPTYSLISTIDVAEVFTRFEVLVVAYWILGTFIKISVYLWASTHAISQTFSVMNSRYIVLPIVLVFIASAFFGSGSIVDLIHTHNEHVFHFTLFQTILPLCLIPLALIRRAIAKKQEGEKLNGA